MQKMNKLDNTLETEFNELLESHNNLIQDYQDLQLKIVNAIINIDTLDVILLGMRKTLKRILENEQTK